MDDSQLLHPNLLRNEELIALINERQLNINNLQDLSRNELIELFKKHIMPKPQRQKKGCNSQSQETTSTNNLVNEVKRIKLNHHTTAAENNHVRQNERHLKRNYEDQNQNVSNKQKRQRIQWP